MVAVVSGYREEVFDFENNRWVQLTGFATSSNPKQRRVHIKRKFLIHAELSATSHNELLLGQNVNIVNNVISNTDQRRSQFFRGEDIMYVDHTDHGEFVLDPLVQVQCCESSTEESMHIQHISTEVRQPHETVSELYSTLSFFRLKRSKERWS